MRPFFKAATRCFRAAISLLCAIYLLISVETVLADDQRHYFLVKYHPGPNWQEGLVYEQQPEMDAHLDFLQKLYYRKVMLMNGPLENSQGSLVLIKAASLAAVEDILASDPAVKNQLLRPEVHVWRVITSAMRNVRPKPLDIAPNEKFTVKRVDPDSPITLQPTP